MRVLIAIPNLGWMRPELASFLLHLVGGERRYEFKIIFPSEKPGSVNRNRYSKRVVDEGWDYLLTIDSDVVPDRNPLDLVELDLDIIGCPTPTVKDAEVGWLVLRKVDDGWKQVDSMPEEPFECDAVGGGCMLISRRVLEHPEMRAPWNITYNKDGFIEEGSDFALCRRAKDLGFKVWAHGGYRTSHFVDFVNVRNLLSS